MADALSLSSTFHGVVVSANEKGFRLDGHTAWLNFSKFAPIAVPPLRGDTVTVTVDSKGFVRSVVPADGSNGTPATNGALRPAQSSSAASERERTITRLAVLKAAAEFAAGRHELKSGEVLKIAESWERWVNRPADDLELDEAF